MLEIILDIDLKWNFLSTHGWVYKMVSHATALF